MPNPLTLEIYIQLSWKWEQKVYTNTNFLKMSKSIWILSMSALFYCNDQFSEKVIKIFCSNLTEEMFLGAYNDKYNVIQVLQSNYVYSNCSYSQ